MDFSRRDWSSDVSTRPFTDKTMNRRSRFAGFDTNPARRDLLNAGFARTIESGLKGGFLDNNFDTISFHTALPNPRKVEELWPDLSKEEADEIAAEQERVARDNPGYQKLGGDVCGRRDLADESVAVPFVGTAAASFVMLAEAIRLLHDPVRLMHDLKL